MNKRRLARIIGFCAAAIIIIAGVILLPVGCGEPPPDPPSHGLQFDGVEDYVACGDDDSLDLATDLTIAFWVKRKTDGDSANPGILGRFVGHSHGYGVRIHRDTGAVTFETHHLETRHQTVSLGVVTGDEWTHIAVSYGSGALKCGFYINGVLDVERDVPSGLAGGPATFVIGDYWWHYFSGIISEVRVYDRALSPEEISEVYKNQDVASGLVSYWKLNEGMGVVAHDSAANSNNGVLHGDPAWIGGGG